MSSPFRPESQNAASSQWPGKDVSLDDFTEASFDDVEGEDESPHWLWCLLSVSGGNQVWVHSAAENHPDGLRFRPTGPLPAGDAGVRIFSSGTEIRLKRAGFVSNDALVLGAALSCVPTRERPAALQSRHKRRSYTDANTLDPSIPIADDSLVDQRCPRFPRDIFMRMARAGAFPARKIGKRWVARFGDVRRAFDARSNATELNAAVPKPADEPSRRDTPPDPMNSLRRKYGIKEREK